MDVNMFHEDEDVYAQQHPHTKNFEGHLPFPRVIDGEIHTEYIDIDIMKKPQLTALCHQFNLPHSGSMVLLRERLRQFSRSPEKWHQLESHARRAHLGPQSGRVSKISAPKKSVQRRNEMFKQPPSKTTFPTILSTAVPEQRWNEAQHVTDMNWAVYIMNLYPYRKEETRMALAARDAQQLNGSVSVHRTTQIIGHQISATAGTSISTTLDSVRASSASASPSILPHNTCRPSSFPQSGTTAVSIPTVSDALQPVCKSDTPGAGISTVTQPSLPTSSCSGKNRILARSIVLANNQKLTFTMDDVPAPPVVSFAKDIPSLNRMWDDTSEYWDGHSKLIICGVPIPIVYWKEVYTSKPISDWKPKQWESLKGKWFDWKVLVRRWRAGTPDQFWEEFSEDGKQLGYKAVLKRLAEQRTKREVELAEKIKVEFGDSFSSHFSYVKKGQTHVKTKPCHIIKQYNKMKGSISASDCDDDADDTEDN